MDMCESCAWADVQKRSNGPFKKDGVVFEFTGDVINCRNKHISSLDLSGEDIVCSGYKPKTKHK